MPFLRLMFLRRTMRLGAATIVAGFASTFMLALAPVGADAFARVADPGGGTILAGTVGTGTLQEATATLKRRVHAEFGERPTIVQAAQNASAHSATLLFTEIRGGTSYTGMAIINAVPGAVAGGAADGTYNFGAGAGGRFSTFAFLTPPDINGLWGMHNSSVWVAMGLLAKDAATAEAVLQSVKIDSNAVAKQNAEINEMYRERFQTQIGIAREETAERTGLVDEAMADDRAAQEGMHRQAVAMENHSLDRAVVIDTRNGEHSTVDSGFADTRTAGDADYQRVPTQDMLRGVDY